MSSLVFHSKERPLKRGDNFLSNVKICIKNENKNNLN